MSDRGCCHGDSAGGGWPASWVMRLIWCECEMNPAACEGCGAEWRQTNCSTYLLHGRCVGVSGKWSYRSNYCDRSQRWRQCECERDPTNSQQLEHAGGNRGWDQSPTVDGEEIRNLGINLPPSLDCTSRRRLEGAEGGRMIIPVDTR